jgi:hypothetical protein
MEKMDLDKYYERIPIDGDNGCNVFGKAVDWDICLGKVLAVGGSPVSRMKINPNLLVEALKHVVPRDDESISIYMISKENEKQPILIMRDRENVFLLCGME